MNVLEDLKRMINNMPKAKPFYGLPIIQSDVLVIRTQVRKHKKKRINKKWLKRYGYKTSPDPNVYIINDTVYAGGQKIIAHPKTALIIERAIGKLK